MSETRTLCQLLDRGEKVYLYLANDVVWNRFIRQAVEEGFQWQDKSDMREKRPADVVVLMQDKTIHYLGGQSGHMLFRSEENLFRVNFARYINGGANYIYTPVQFGKGT